MTKEKPAILGGEQILKEFLPIIRPTLPKIDDIKNDINEVLSSGMITNYKYVKEFEKKLTDYLGVKHAVTLNTASSGLMLALKLFGIKGEVIVPSFTFVATVHSLIWNNIKPVFVDCELDSFNMDPNKIEELITDKTSAIMPVHIFGNPCNLDAIQKIADKHNLKLVVDAAHAMGSIYNNEKIGKFGDVEIFCMAPTKIVTSGEGGIVCTNNEKLAKEMAGARDYGNFGNYECKFAGLSARMSEFNATLGIKSFEMLEQNIRKRNELVQLFKKEVKDVEGIRFQVIKENCRSAYQAFAMIIDEKKFGMNKFQLAEALKKENIMTKTTYFDPCVHEQKAYEGVGKRIDLSCSENIARRIICIPLFSHLPEEKMIAVANAIKRIHENSREIVKVLETKK